MNSSVQERKTVIIGAGIAGLCAAVYARKCGYAVELIEQQNSVGGLATSWNRGDYTFENCVHWLLGARTGSPMYSRWQEVFDIDKLKFVHADKFARIETDGSERLDIYTDVDRMEAELLRAAPRDEHAIQAFAADIRRLAHFPMPDAGEPWPRNLLSSLRLVPYLPTLRRLGSQSAQEYGKRFTHPLLRAFFGEGELADLSAVALVFSLAWMSQRDAAYPVGGSRAVTSAILDNFLRLGGKLTLGAKVNRILVEDGAACGVTIEDRHTIGADWVISAADGHTTIYGLLGGHYRDRSIDTIYQRMKPFPSYVQVSLGIKRDLSRHEGYLIRLLQRPLVVDPATELRQIAFRNFHYDPTFAARGKTAVTCFLPTSNYEHWEKLRDLDPAHYQAEKQRVSDQVIAELIRAMPEVRHNIEVIDVSTPATVIAYTGNWQGSMEGWMLMPRRGFRPLPQTLPGLRQFMMAGQWVMPGGGLPSGLMTARAALQAMCKQDHMHFLPAEAATSWHPA